MGFTTGFLGGFTLTSSVLYLTIALHAKNRAQQAALLRQQRLVLSHVIEPPPPAPDAAPREVDAGLLEMAKDRWNRELEGVVRKVYDTDWRRKREELEDRFDSMVQKLREQK